MMMFYYGCLIFFRPLTHVLRRWLCRSAIPGVTLFEPLDKPKGNRGDPEIVDEQAAKQY